MGFAKLTACSHCKRVGRIIPNKVAEFDYRNVSNVHLCRTGDGDVVVHYDELGLEPDPKPIKMDHLDDAEKQTVEDKLIKKET